MSHTLLVMALLLGGSQAQQITTDPRDHAFLAELLLLNPNLATATGAYRKRQRGSAPSGATNYRSFF